VIARIRLQLSAFFFLLSLASFFAWGGDRLTAFFNALHPFPSLAPLARFDLPPTLLLTAAVLLLPLLVGRLYCSYVCPAGFLQDLAARLTGPWKIRPRAAAGSWSLRLFLLALAAGLLALRSPAFHYLDHFCNLGRAYSLLLVLLDYAPFGPAALLGLSFMAVLGAAPAFRPRWFCGTLCPTGTLYALLQKRSLWKVSVREDCDSCGACAAACPALCIDRGRIDPELCIQCLECTGACPRGAIGLRRSPGRRADAAGAPPAGGEGRKRLLRSALLWFTGSLWAGMFRTIGAQAAPPVLSTVVPPGGRSGSRFAERCVACQTCVSVCPTGVLVPCGLQRGSPGVAAVRLDFMKSYCSYECNACLAVCPSRAISYYPLEVKKTIKIGSSALDTKLCIPYADKKDCAACHEVCPTGAVEMVKRERIFAPELRKDYCIGCGSCQKACPTQPVKAIVVLPQEIHSFAFNPKQHGPGAARRRLRIAAAKKTEFPF